MSRVHQQMPLVSPYKEQSAKNWKVSATVTQEYFLVYTKGPKINSNLAQTRQALDFMSQTEYTISDKHITLLYLVYGLESWSVLEIESHVCHITFLTVFTKAMYRELDTLSSSYAFGLASSYAFGLVKMVYSYSLLTKST